MILPHQEIKRRLDEGELQIEPLDEARQIQPNSVDLRLGDHVVSFDRLNETIIDPLENTDRYGERETIDDQYILNSGEFILAETSEWMSIPNDLTAVVYGRSSWARLAIQPHSAGLLDSGWRGYTTLEIFNQGPMPIRLVPGRRFCQVVFMELTSPTDQPYDGKYQEQSGVEKSRMKEEIR